MKTLILMFAMHSF